MKAGITGLVALLAIAGCAAQNHPKIAEDYASAAYRAQQNNDWAMARLYFGRAIQSATLGDADENNLADLWFQYGRSSGVICDWNEADRGFTQAYNIYQTTGSTAYLPLYELGQLNFDRQHYSAALVYFKRVQPEFKSRHINTQDPIGYAGYLYDYATALEKTDQASAAANFRNQSTALYRTFPGRGSTMEKTPYGTECQAA